MDTEPKYGSRVYDESSDIKYGMAAASKIEPDVPFVVCPVLKVTEPLLPPKDGPVRKTNDPIAVDVPPPEVMETSPLDKEYAFDFPLSKLIEPPNPAGSRDALGPLITNTEPATLDEGDHV